MSTTRFTLSGKSYCCKDIFRSDIDNKLSAGWMCLGRADEIPNAGDFFTLQLFDEPLLIVRGQDEKIRVLANSCRHRASPVAEGSGNSKRFVCPYHAWSYSLDGALRSAPRMPKKLTKDLCLPEYRSEIWRGFLYVNISGTAAPLAPGLQALDERLAPYETETFQTFHVGEKVWHANWRALVENFVEAYHLSVVHSQTLHGYTPTRLARKFAGSAAFTGYCANYAEDAADRGHGAPNLSAEERRRSTLFSVFPCHLVSQAASLIASFCLIPEAPGRTRVRWSLSSYGDDLSEELKAVRIELWRQVNEEDRARMEATQRGIASKFAGAGPLADDDFEGTIADFHCYLAAEP